MFKAIFNDGSKTSRMQIAQDNKYISLQILPTSPAPPEHSLDFVQCCAIKICLNEAPFSPVFAPPGSDDFTSSLYMALDKLGTITSPDFNANAFSVSSEESQLLLSHEIRDGIFVVPVLPDPRQHQMVLRVNGQDAFLRHEYIKGFPPKNGNLGEWTVWQSPDFQFSLGCTDLPTQWRQLAKAIQIHAIPDRQPFEERVRNNPSMDLMA